MSNTITNTTTTIVAGSAWQNAAAPRVSKPSNASAAGSTADSAALAKVDEVKSYVAYTASLDTLRTVNKMMMGYLLNIEV